MLFDTKVLYLVSNLGAIKAKKKKKMNYFYTNGMVPFIGGHGYHRWLFLIILFPNIIP